MFLNDPETAFEPSHEWLGELFCLSPSEARLAAAVAARRTISEYARDAGIAVSTARWTLKRVLEKTGCRRQAELVQVVTSSLAGTMHAASGSAMLPTLEKLEGER